MHVIAHIPKYVISWAELLLRSFGFSPWTTERAYGGVWLKLGDWVSNSGQKNPILTASQTRHGINEPQEKAMATECSSSPMLHLPKMALPPSKKRERDNTKGYNRHKGCFFPVHQVNWLWNVSRGDAGYPSSAYQTEASYHMLYKLGKKRGEQPECWRGKFRGLLQKPLKQ